MRRLPVAIFGATGLVGQVLVKLLHDHPWFKLQAVVASERSAGKAYGDTVDWKLDSPLPEEIAGLGVVSADNLPRLAVAFSALPSSVAARLEPRLAADGWWVFSNASSFRMADDVPLIIPEVNANHLRLVDRQSVRGWKGRLVTNPNCSTVGLVMALAPLHRAIGVSRVNVATFQALSGAGLTGLSNQQADANVLPYIAGEEEKLESEPLKILGDADTGPLTSTEMAISAQCHRVPVVDGHLLAFSISLARESSVSEIEAVWRAARGCGLPSSPRQTLHVSTEPDRPQPALDRDRGDGMIVTVGRLRRCNVLDYRFAALVHNTVRGAAGATLLNAELARARGYLG